MAGFKLRKWASNKEEVLQNVPNEDCLSTVVISSHEAQKTKALGVLWNAEADVFSFHVQLPNVNHVPTKETS